MKYSTNVALLLLARAAGRQQELSIRAAIGASRGRLISQLTIEAVVLAAIGCLAGAGLAYRCVPWIVRGLPENSFPNAASIQINTSVLLFAVLISLSTGLLCGLWPAIDPPGRMLRAWSSRRLTEYPALAAAGWHLHNQDASAHEAFVTRCETAKAEGMRHLELEAPG